MATSLNATTPSICPHNGTAHDGTVLCHWTNSPSARGTLNIFWLCISTLGLCVWNAVHPDVPRPKTPGWRVFGKRVWWLFVGLFMPEMLVLVALGQFRQAWKLLVDIDKENSAPTEFPWWMYLVKSWRPQHGNPDSPANRWMKALLRWLRVHSRSDSDRQTGVARESAPSSSAVVRANDATAQAAPTSSDTSQQAQNSPNSPRSNAQASSRKREHPWTLTHSFYAVVGGFVNNEGHPIDIDTVPRCLALPPADPEPIVAVSVGDAGANRIALLLGDPKPLLIWRGKEISVDDLRKRLALSPEEPGYIAAVPVDDADIKNKPTHVALLGDPDRIPDVSVDDLEDRGKAGIFAKSLLVWQLFVFLANCFARWDQSLPLSLLEITTIGHSLCSIIAMVLWWYKPHSVGEATVIDRKDPILAEHQEILHELGDALGRGVDKILGDVDGPARLLSFTILAIAISILYGLPHLLGLSIHFPTLGERRCWQISTGTVIGSPLVLCGIIWIVAYRDNLGRTKNAAMVSLSLLSTILLVLYPIASMFIVGESVRQIFALPVESFHEPQLTIYLPSFS